MLGNYYLNVNLEAILHSILIVMTQLDPDLSVKLSFIGIIMANKIRNANDREQLTL